MNDLLKNLMEQLRATSGGTKLIAMMGGASFLVIIGLAAVVSRKTDFNTTVFAGLSPAEASKVAAALNTAGIEFDVSLTEPYFIKVDEGDRSRARVIAFSSNALSSAPAGVQTESGMGGVFASADQRGQVVDKLNEEEIELMLAELDFVERASVRISQPTTTAIGNRNDKPMSVAVIVTVGGPPTAHQRNSLASLVTNATGVDNRYISITDHNGNRLFDGSDQTEAQGISSDQLDKIFAYDQKTSALANDYLERVYGPNMASVMVKSEWDFEQRVEHTESSAGEIVTSETKNISSKTGGSQGGGIPGLAPGGAASNGTPETSEQSSKTRRPLIKRIDSVNSQPVIKHLNVALTLDSSLKDIETQLGQVVMGLVGFSANRADTLSTVVRDLYVIPADEEAAVEEREPTTAPNPMLETLMRRGVEVLTASIFILVLMKSLKSANKPAPGEPGSPDAPESELDLEMLARANVDDLLKSDPERVGEVLTAWARGEQTTGAK